MSVEGAIEVVKARPEARALTSVGGKLALDRLSGVGSFFRSERVEYRETTRRTFRTGNKTIIMTSYQGNLQQRP